MGMIRAFKMSKYDPDSEHNQPRCLAPTIKYSSNATPSLLLTIINPELRLMNGGLQQGLDSYSDDSGKTVWSNDSGIDGEQQKHTKT